MAWLVHADRRIPLEIADTPVRRARGLLGRRGFDGALLLSATNAVHTLGMAFAIDVAHLDADLRVLAVTTMPPHRLGRRVRAARHVLEAEAGRFAAWGVTSGVRLRVEGAAGTEAA